MATSTRAQLPKRNGAPGRGRPHDLDRPVQFSGRTLPAAEAVAAIMRSGEPLTLAAQACGLNADTVYSWRRDGQRIWSDLTEGRRTRSRLTAYQTAAVAFSEAVSRAEAEAEALMAARIGQAASGGLARTRTITEYNGAGAVTARKVTEETTAPDPKAAMFWLERRAPARWGRVQRVEHALGAEGATVGVDESPLARLVGALADIERRREQGTVLVSATEAVEVDE